MSSMASTASFSTRAEVAHADDKHPLKAYLFQLIAAKKSNLCVSADVHSTSALLRLAEEVGDYICVLKTHADIVDDFGERTIKSLIEISTRRKFLIFEDRKFGDIGNTVQAQYTRGPLRIATWAHFVNVHIFPGPSIVTALKEAAESTVKSLKHSVSTEIFVGTPHASSEGEQDDDSDLADSGQLHRSLSRSGRKDSVVATTTISQTVEMSRQVSQTDRAESSTKASGGEPLSRLGHPPIARGLLLFAQMSSEGNFMDKEYTKHCIEAARDHDGFVVGYIAQRDLNLSKDDNFVTMTPGVKLPPPGEDSRSKLKGDGLGQQYRTPQTVIGDDGCDIAIVGRGILGAKDRAKEAERYRAEAWKAYELRIGRKKQSARIERWDIASAAQAGQQCHG